VGPGQSPDTGTCRGPRVADALEVMAH
jgi:hypothetical protein